MTAPAHELSEVEVEVIRFLASQGYGYEDICVKLNIRDKRAVRKIVIG